MIPGYRHGIETEIGPMQVRTRWARKPAEGHLDSPPGLRTRDRSLPGSGTTAPQRGDANVPIRWQNAILINLEKALKSGIFRRWKFLAFWPVQHILDHEQQIRTKQRIRPRWALTFCTDLNPDRRVPGNSPLVSCPGDRRRSRQPKHRPPFPASVRAVSQAPEK